jgi:hypothetical protein
MWAAGLLALAVALGGCAEPGIPGWVYQRADTTDALRRADYRECLWQTRSVGINLVCRDCREGAVWECMHAKGYVLQQVAR